MTHPRTLFCASALFCATAVCSANAQDLKAIRAGKVLTGTGSEIQDAVILIEDGRITTVAEASTIEVPWNATVVDAADKVVMPTYVLAHTSGGLSRNAERMANVPFLTVADGIDPSSTFFEETLRNGIGCMHVIPGNNTLIGGVGMVVRPVGKVVEDMTMRDRAGLKLSLMSSGSSQVAKIRQMRRALQDADDVRKDLARREAEFDREKTAGATEEKKFDEEPNITKRSIVELLDGELRGYLYLPTAAHVPEAARMQQKYGDMQLTLIVSARCYKAARQLAALKLPVILESSAIEFWETDPETEEETLISPAKILADAGVPLILSVSTSSSGAQRYPWWQMATAIRNGVDRKTAMRAFTLEPAKALGLDGELGSIEPGKIANLQILTGDPLDATTWVETVMLEGDVVYERSEDTRLRHQHSTDN